MKKQCSKCGEVKDVGEFYKDKSHTCGYRSQCKICITIIRKECRKNNRTERLIHRDKLKEINDKLKRTNEKKCGICGEVKKINEFGNREDSKDGNRFECRACMNIQKKEYYRSNRTSILEKSKEYGVNNKDKRAAKNKIWRENNKKKIVEGGKNYYKENKEVILNKMKKYNKDNKGKRAVSHKEWKEKNKEYILLKQRERYKNDINYRLSMNLRNRIIEVLKGKNKSATTMEFLGCTIEEFKQHLESQFTQGMTLDNHGYYGWHIDHIKPCSLFDLSDPEQQRQCFHYSNMQPLWAEDNFIKHTKYEEAV